MDTASVARTQGRRKRRGRTARTNRGKFGSLERRYWKGQLSESEQEVFESLCLQLHRLYRDDRA
jgi:hypothetical protein